MQPVILSLLFITFLINKKKRDEATSSELLKLPDYLRFWLSSGINIIYSSSTAILWNWSNQRKS